MPPKVTLDTNLFYDKAEEREGAGDFDAIIELAKDGKVRLFSTATTDFEDQSGAATRIVLRLMKQGLIQEAKNAGTPREYMPHGPGTHHVSDEQLIELLDDIWPEAKWLRADHNKRYDVYHLLAHKLNGHEIYLTRDGKILKKRDLLKEKYGITAMSPRELIDLVTQ